ncbi:MAG: acyl-CoA dehydrogenase family protein, partial [Acidobacteriota bacterium]
MDWELNPDQQMVRETVREFVAAEVVPRAAAWDRQARFPEDVFRQLGGLGLFGMTIEERWGGAGLDGITYCVALEELARGD